MHNNTDVPCMYIKSFEEDCKVGGGGRSSYETFWWAIKMNFDNENKSLMAYAYHPETIHGIYLFFTSLLIIIEHHKSFEKNKAHYIVISNLGL